jgi:4-amino-4-deoxy-L-arabinose transferase-like glycosyltransferase
MYAPQEGRAGIIVRNMTDSGDYLTMQFKGHDTSEKPICFYWLCLASSKIFGFNEFAFRFPSALASCLGVLLAYLLGRRIYCERRVWSPE